LDKRVVFADLIDGIKRGSLGLKRGKPCAARCAEKAKDCERPAPPEAAAA
jgi:hypothetical protein